MAVHGEAKVVLAPLLEDDAEFLFGYRSRPEIWRYQTWVPTSVVEAFAFVRNFGGVETPRTSGWSQFAVRISRDGRMVGDCGCHILDPETAEIGYTIAPPFRGVVWPPGL